MWAAKIGSLAYASWSLLHIALGVSRLSERSANGMLSEAAGRTLSTRPLDIALPWHIRSHPILVQLEKQ